MLLLAVPALVRLLRAAPAATTAALAASHALRSFAAAVAWQQTAEQVRQDLGICTAVSDSVQQMLVHATQWHLAQGRLAHDAFFLIVCCNEPPHPRLASCVHERPSKRQPAQSAAVCHAYASVADVRVHQILQRCVRAWSLCRSSCL